MFINLICWAAIGMITGLIAGKFVNQHGDDPKLGVALAATGAVIGGLLFGLFGSDGISAFNAAALWGAVIGGAVVIAAWHSFRAARA